MSQQMLRISFILTVILLLRNSVTVRSQTYDILEGSGTDEVLHQGTTKQKDEQTTIPPIIINDNTNEDEITNHVTGSTDIIFIEELTSSTSSTSEDDVDKIISDSTKHNTSGTSLSNANIRKGTEDKGMKPGIIAAICVATIVLAILVIIIASFLSTRKPKLSRNRKPLKEDSTENCPLKVANGNSNV